MLNIVEYEAASSRDKERINLLVTTNSTGQLGYCIPTDMACEHRVRQIKDLLRSYHNQLETVLIEKSVLAQNVILKMSDHFHDSIGKPQFKPGGEHRHEYLDDEEKAIVREELKRVNMFSLSEREEKVTFNVPTRRVWENLSDEKIDKFLDRNCKSHSLKKTYRFN